MPLLAFASPAEEAPGDAPVPNPGIFVADAYGVLSNTPTYAYGTMASTLYVITLMGVDP